MPVLRVIRSRQDPVAAVQWLRDILGDERFDEAAGDRAVMEQLLKRLGYRIGQLMKGLSDEQLAMMHTSLGALIKFAKRTRFLVRIELARRGFTVDEDPKV